MKRRLPTIEIKGTAFLVDVSKSELREQDNPGNSIYIPYMNDIETGYQFEYDKKSKNFATAFSSEGDRENIVLPPMVDLDPVGMAEKFGKKPEEVIGKSDYEVIVDQEVLNQRLQGRLTTIDIAGHIFFVDIPMGMLRPKDDFLSKGIVFREVEHYFSDEKNAYIIPYNPSTHEFNELDYRSISEYPKDLIAIEFPHERVLDPVGFNRKGGGDLFFGLKETSIQAHFFAKIIEWKDTGIDELIGENRKKQMQQQKQQKMERGEKNSRRLRRSRGI